MLGWRGILEILILGLIFYYLFRLLRGTRGVHVLVGAIIFFLGLLALSYALDLRILGWALKNLAPYLLIAFFVIFQPEMRRGLSEIGRNSIFNSSRASNSRSLIDTISAAADTLSDRKIGALIAIERGIGLREVIETGSPVDSAVSPELLTSIFFPRAPLHDGGVIIQDNRIVCAACVFPLSEQQGIGKNLGTRHRAALGLSENSDAVIVVVSEETGSISLAYRGDLRRGLDAKELSEYMGKIMQRAPESASKDISDVKEAQALAQAESLAQADAQPEPIDIPDDSLQKIDLELELESGEPAT